MAELKIYAKPSNLYRYRPLANNTEREVQALEEGCIYCPAFSQMNDPMEGLHRLSARFVAKQAESTRHAEIRAALRDMGIASLSEVYDHEPMWAHYADGFKGMCVQYSLNRLLKGLDPEIAITRLMYSEGEPVLLDDRTATDRALLALSSKTVRWASERAWRVFRAYQGKAKYKDLSTVTKIFLGSRVSEPDERRVRQAGDRLGAEVVKMEIDAYPLTFKSRPRRKRLQTG